MLIKTNSDRKHWLEPWELAPDLWPDGLPKKLDDERSFEDLGL